MVATAKPDWEEKEKIAEWVGKRLEDAALEQERQFVMRYVECDVPDVTFRDISKQMEADAVKRARSGNFEQLADMLRAGNRLLAQETLNLIADRLTGRFKAPRRGPPEQTINQLWSNSPIHAIAAEMEDIDEILRAHYGDKRGIRDRAIAIAARRGGIEYDKLANHLKSKRYKKGRRA
jgi:hypothetical protein